MSGTGFATGVQLHEHDLPAQDLQSFREAQSVAWDIETSGLDWRGDRIGTCQLRAPGGDPTIVVHLDERPPNLSALLADLDVEKVFHHAMFDLRFMAHHWEVVPSNVACTKVAAKLLHKEEDNGSNGLKDLLERYLGISVEKGFATSDWFAKTLTEEQKTYAVEDVVHLHDLLRAIEKKLAVLGRLDLARSCFEHIPTRVQLEISGFADPFVY